MLARKFNLSYRYTDDLISFSYKRFDQGGIKILPPPNSLVFYPTGMKFGM